MDLNHLRSDGRGDLARRIMRRPAPYICALREAARDVALAMDPAFMKTLKDKDILIGFEGRCVGSVLEILADNYDVLRERNQASAWAHLPNVWQCLCVADLTRWDG